MSCQRLIVVSILALFLSGCAGGMPAERTVVVSPMLDMGMDDLLPDQELVLASLVERLRGNGPVGPVSFESTGSHAVAEDDFRYDGFGVSGLVITGYDAKPFGNGVALVYFDGGMLFEDGLGFRTSVRFAVSYLVFEDRIVIRASSVSRVGPDFPRVQAFYLPGSISDIPAGRVETMADLYAWTLEHAVPMRQATNSGVAEGKYTILVFCLDRLRQEAEFAAAVTQSRSGGRKIGEMEHVEDRGWRVGMIKAEFTPGSARSPFYVRVKYNADPRGDGEDVLVGLFANSMSSGFSR